MGLLERYGGGQSLATLAGGYVLGLSLLLAACGFGLPVGERDADSRPWHARLVLSFSSGLSIVWLLTFLAGHLGLLSRAFVLVLVFGGLLVLGAHHRAVRSHVVHLVGAAARARAAAVVLGGTGLLLLLGGARPPLADDEVGYHWPSPLAWAEAGGWEKVPFRLSDGTAAMEQLYTLAALYGSSTAAHVLHVGTLVLLCAATASVAASLGGRGWVAALLVVSIPAAVTQAFLSYNDVGAAAFSAAALVAFLHARSRVDHLVVGLLSATAISVKPLVAVPLAFALLAVLVQRRRAGRGLPSLTQVAVAAVPLVLIGGAWLAHTTRLTGHPLPEGDGFVVARTADNPLNTIRLPTAADVLRSPVEPLWTPIAGRRAPYGGRTGLAVYLLVPLLIIPASRARLCRVAPLLWASLAFFVLAGPFLPRTRFILPVHTLLVVAICVGIGERPRRGWQAAVLVVALVGLADASRRILVPLL